MAARHRYLLGPQLLLQQCLKEPKAIAWAKTVDDADCVLSRLAIAIAVSVINARAKDEVNRSGWHQSLNTVLANMNARGSVFIDLDEPILKRFHLYRLHAPLDCKGPKGPVPVGHDVRLLITTVAVMELVYVEYDDLYLHQMQQMGLKVHIL